MRSLVVITALAILGVWGAHAYLPCTEANAEAAVNRPVAKMQTVRSVAFDGHELPLALLRDVLETHPGDPVDNARLARDRQAIERVLADRGYFAAHVEPATVTFDAVGAAYVTFDIVLGPLFHLRQIAVTGAGKGAAVVTISSGDVALRDRVDRAREALADSLVRRGMHSDVALSLHTDLAAAAVDVVLATR